MTRVTLFIAALALLIPASTFAQNAAQIDKGKQVYAREKCSVCHSIGGTGNKKGPLDDVGSRLSVDDIRSWIVSAPEMTAKTKAARKPLMKSYTLQKDDLEALVAYMASLRK